MNIDQFDSFVEDLLGEKLERPLIIVGASKIDDLLLSILSKLLFIPKKNDEDDLLKGDNPLSTFSSRIKLVYRLGIIDEGLLKVLEQVRKLRNLCAHSIEFNINRSPVREHISELKKLTINRQSFILTRTRFFQNPFKSNEDLQCIFITICVILESIHEAVIKTTGNTKTLKISNK